MVEEDVKIAILPSDVSKSQELQYVTYVMLQRCPGLQTITSRRKRFTLIWFRAQRKSQHRVFFSMKMKFKHKHIPIKIMSHIAGQYLSQ